MRKIGRGEIFNVRNVQRERAKNRKKETNEYGKIRINFDYHSIVNDF